jgi:serine/threonine protein kinase
VIAPVAYSDAFQPGDTLGKYEIVRELAVGGMARIYLARVRGTAGFEKSVVLKCILPSLASDRQFVSMFLDEARLAATLRHSNIADVFDVGVEGKTYYFAMEYIAGQNARAVRLKARETGVQIPVEVSLAIVGGTASALHYAHTRIDADGKSLDLVHRDVSPSNILVGYEGAIKLVDFGIARATSRRMRTRTGIQRKGKVPYLSPELCRGTQVDHRSDLFSLGTVLYELTTGQRPFLGNSDFVVMDQIVTCEPEPPSLVVKGYPQGLEEIVMRMLTKTPEQRYQSAGQVLEALEQLTKHLHLLTSAHIVARFMKELFGEAATERFERDTYLDFAQPSGKTTREYPDRQPPAAIMANLTRGAEEEPTAAYSRGEQLWTPEMKVKVRTPRPRTEQGYEAAFHEPTHQDVVLPFDPIDARSEEILAQLDAEAPDEETPQQRTHRRILTLIDRAIGWVESGELDKAVTAIELALDEDVEAPGAQELLQDHVATIVSVYEAMLEDPYRVPALLQSIEELATVPMEDGARTLLPWIDGRRSVAQILQQSGMHRLEAYHHLCQLMLRGMVA